MRALRTRLAGFVAVASLAAVLVAVGTSVPAPPSAASGRPTALTGTPTTRPPALIRAGDSKTTCIDVALKNYNLPASLAPVQRATHIRFNCLVTYSNADVSWAAWVSPWIFGPQYGFKQWLAADRLHRTIVITQNLVPDNVDHQAGWEAQCASGAFRGYGRQLAAHLIRNGFGYSVVRLGPEMNGTWYYDSLGTTPTSWRDWARCFAQTVDAMRSVRGAHFLFDWNVNAGYRPIPLAAYYPGDRYVDIVGIDAYDSRPTGALPPISSPRRWTELVNEPYGLAYVYRFAARHGKPLSLPEWGSVTPPQGGDDGAYVAHIGRFVATHNVAYQAWFDTPSDGVLQLDPTTAPRSVAAYVTAFGPGSVIARYQQRLDTAPA